jgi:hypothetical protein
MIQEGKYRIFRLRHGADGQTHRQLMTRIWVSGGNIWHLEDHGHFGEDLFPEGPVTGKAAKRFQQMQHNGYYQIVHEDALGSGHHPEHIRDLEFGDVQAEHKFIMTGDGMKGPTVLELWDHAVVVDGRRLDDSEAQHLLSEVQAGRVTLTPVE